MTTIIDAAKAKSLIAEYQTQNSEAGSSAITTAGGLPLNGFFLDRSSLLSLLADEKVTGVSLHLAKDPNSKASDNYFTVLFTAATGMSAPYTASGTIYNSPPCPPDCTKL